MVEPFKTNAALLLVGVQEGVGALSHCGGTGVTGHRNDPCAEANMRTLLAEWRPAGPPVFYCA